MEPTYDIIKKLGSGTYGTVYEVKDKYTKNIYALKESYIDVEGVNVLEFHILFTIVHPNIIRGIYFTSRDDPLRSYIYMELADMTLKDYISTKGNIDEDRLIYEFLSAMSFLHANNFVHCDIKPDNILILNDSIKLADFGLVELNSYIPNVCMAYFFAPPEAILQVYPQYKNGFKELKEFITDNYYEEILPESIDIWAVGMIIYYIIEKKHFFIFSDVTFVPEYLTFLKNYSEEIRSRLTNYKYLPCLLKCLNPHVSLRSDNINDVFMSSPAFKKGIRDKLILGSTDYNEVNFYKEPFKLKYEFTGEILMITYFAFLDLFYRLYYILEDESKLEDYQIICFIIACKLYDKDIFVEYFEKVDDYEEKEIEVLELLDGHVIYNNFYTYAFSLQSLIDIYPLTLDSYEYLSTDYKSYMTELEFNETAEQRGNRESINIKYNEFIERI